MSELVLPGRTYRIVDRVSKLLGVVLLVGALELGIASAPGVALALAGALFGVCTVFVTENIQ